MRGEASWSSRAVTSTATACVYQPEPGAAGDTWNATVGAFVSSPPSPTVTAADAALVPGRSLWTVPATVNCPGAA